MTLSTTTKLFRGSTVLFTTTFYDVNNAVVQPASAFINIDYPNPTGGGNLTTLLTMLPTGGGAVTWNCSWDSRNAGSGTVSWSVHTGTGSPIPVAVEDGQFVLTANPANLLTF